MKNTMAGILCVLITSIAPLSAAERALPDEVTLNVGDVENVGENITIVLKKRSVRSDNYMCGTWTDDGFKEFKPFPVCTYRGHVKGDLTMRVNANIEPGGKLNANFSEGADIIAAIRDMKVDVGAGRSTRVMAAGNKVVPWSTWKPRVSPVAAGYMIPVYPTRRITLNVIINRSYIEQVGGDLEQAVAEVEQRFNDSDFVYARDLGTAWEINTIACEMGSRTNSASFNELIESDPARRSTLLANIHGGPGGNGSRAGPAFITGGGIVYALGHGREGGALLHEIGHKFTAWHQNDDVDIMSGCRAIIGQNNLQVMLRHCARSNETNFPGVIYSDALPPRALNDFAGTLRDKPVDIDVLANDYDSNGDAFSLTGAGPKSDKGGTLVLSDDGKRAVYTPPPGFVGQDTFFYSIVDSTGQGSRSGRVKVDVRADGLASHFAFEDPEKEVRAEGVEDSRSWFYDNRDPRPEKVMYHFPNLGPYGGRATAHWMDCAFVPGISGSAVYNPTGGMRFAQIVCEDTGDPGLSSLSASLWVLYPERPEYSGVIISKGGLSDSSLGGSVCGWGMGHLQGGAGFKFMGNAFPFLAEDTFSLQSEDPIRPNTWYHLVMVMDRDAKKLRAWVNNREVLTSTTTTEIPDRMIEHYAPLTMFNSYGWKRWNGSSLVLDEVKIFTSSLDPKDVASLYSEGKDAEAPQIRPPPESEK